MTGQDFEATPGSWNRTSPCSRRCGRGPWFARRAGDVPGRCPVVSVTSGAAGGSSSGRPPRTLRRRPTRGEQVFTIMCRARSPFLGVLR
ncbi:hypothetical protein QJS66_10000 [Kocuria rhizophila]|nr:hypothetical protein QJS66_10000 [Kocuria rhizophila]